MLNPPINSIFNMDCLEGMRLLPDGCIDMVLCDLPYGTTACKWDTCIPFEPLWEQYHRLVKPSGAIVLFGSEPFSTALRHSNLKEFRYDWIWEKEQGANFMLCKYQPYSEMWSAAQRFIGQDYRERRVILHLGDHDPSGKDMTRDIADRLELFGADVEVQRIALNWDQIDEFNPPPNPAKLSDSRASAYIEEFGTESWELDALEPKVLTNLIRTCVADLTDASLLERASAREKRDKAELELVKDNWHDAVDLLRDAGY